MCPEGVQVCGPYLPVWTPGTVVLGNAPVPETRALKLAIRSTAAEPPYIHSLGPHGGWDLAWETVVKKPTAQ